MLILNGLEAGGDSVIVFALKAIQFDLYGLCDMSLSSGWLIEGVSEARAGGVGRDCIPGSALSSDLVLSQ